MLGSSRYSSWRSFKLKNVKEPIDIYAISNDGLNVPKPEEYEEKPTNKIPGFLERLKEMFPGMYEHRCSVGTPGGFFQRVEEGTWMGHVIEHIALELQSLAGMEVGFGRTRGFGEPGVYSVVFSYLEEKAGRYAARASVRIAEALAEGTEYDLEEDLQEMREIRERNRLGPSTGSIIQELDVDKNVVYQWRCWDHIPITEFT